MSLDYRDDAVVLTVEDFAARPVRSDALAAAGSGAEGYGLAGMVRERAELLGGTLTAGATANGFRVLLEVPA